MGKLVFGLLIALSTFLSAKTTSVFMGYTDYEKERYMFLEDVDYAIMYGYHGDDTDRVLKYAVTCMNNKHWHKAELLSRKGKEGFISYEFKFHWVLNSRIIHIDIDGNTMSCRN